MANVTAVIPVYNYEQFIADAVDSALGQTYKDMEIIVVDDGSTDNTGEILKRQYGSKIKYIYQENRGLSAARNLGIKLSSGQFIALLDADDIWLPEKIELQIQIMGNSDLIGIVSCGGYNINEKGKVINIHVTRNYQTKTDFMNDLLLRNVVSGGSYALVRKECFEKAGMFDENLKSAEDWDMWLRISKRYDTEYVELPLAKVRVTEISMSSPMNAHKMLENELRVLTKAFSDKSLKGKWFLKRKSFSYRYCCAASHFNHGGKKKKAIYYILKSILIFPFWVTSAEGSRYGLVAKILFGDKAFKSLASLKPYVTRKRNYLKNL